MQKPITVLALLALLVVVAAPSGASAQLAQTGDTVTYQVRFPHPEHHEAEITVTFAGLPATPLEVRMSRSSPGRYALHEFAKNVYAVRVADGAGRMLTATRPDPYEWYVAGHDGTVQVTYTLFGDLADGTYTGIDRTHAHLNIPATFLYARSLRERPVRVTFDVPDGSEWRVATQLAPTDDPYTFTAPDLDYFMDSPTELSDFRIREWTVSSSDAQTETIRLTVHDPGGDAAVDGYAVMARRVVAEEAAVFGEYPRYDYGTYTFIACYGPWASGDGMEHRNSTSITSSLMLERNAGRLIGTLAHEYFHSWNMERIRSAELEPFAYDRANMSDELWFGEGFTQYYGELALVRAGLTNPEDYIASLGGTVDRVVNAPGRRYHSVVGMSRQAPFVDAATSIDPTNQRNTFISYYTWGAAIGLGLDMMLRTRYDLTLDAFMRAMWVKYGKPYRHYRLDDIRVTLGEYTNDGPFADDFFARYVTGREAMDYEQLLRPAGVLVRRANPDRPTVGPVAFQVQGARLVARVVYVGTPLYEAGVDDGDVITSLDGTAVTSPDQIEDIAERHRAGDTVPITFVALGRTIDAALTFAEDPRLEVVSYETAGLPVTDAVIRFRAEWLGSKAGS